MWQVVKYHLPGIVITVVNCFLTGTDNNSVTFLDGIMPYCDERIVHRKVYPKIHAGINHPVTY